MTRNWVRVNDDRLRDVVTIFDRVERSVKRLAEELDCSDSNARHLLRKAETAGLIGPDWRQRKRNTPTDGDRLPDAATSSEGSETVPRPGITQFELNRIRDREAARRLGRRY